MESLEGKAVLVTGASSGIGLATAREFATAGASVALAARREEKLREIADSIEADAGVETCVVPTDVTDSKQVDRMIERSVEVFAGLDVVVCNAGVGRDGDVETMSDEDYRTMMAVNTDGTFYTTRAALPHIRESAGVLVLVGSLAGKEPYPMNPVYAGTKAWMRGFARSVSAVVGDDDVAISVVNPTGVRTPFGSGYRTPNTERFDPGEVPEPEDVAAAVTFVATQRPPNVVHELDLYTRDQFS